MGERIIQVVPDVKALAVAAAERIITLSDDAKSRRETFSIALSGGNTPKTLFELLATDAYSQRINWDHWEIYWGDERCVPPTDSESNFRMAAQAMLDHVPIPPENIHRMKGELDPQQAAIEYGQLLKQKFGDGGMNLILLGMGDDGHTASLFPHTEALKETKHRCVANFVAKMNVWRITMSAPFINRAHTIIEMVAGASKASRLEEVLQGPPRPEDYPVQMIDPIEGEMIWLLDAAAAGMLE
jgi:6-phosphogluconolactonase